MIKITSKKNIGKTCFLKKPKNYNFTTKKLTKFTIIIFLHENTISL